MKISFAIIAYNEEKNIIRCINSILNQEALKDYEIIVVNDGSKDKTLEIVKNLIKKNKHIKLISLYKNKGRGNARHLGVKKAKGDYIAFVDADIILPKHWLKTCLKHINKNFDAVGGIAVPDGDVTYIWKKFELKPKVKPHTTEVSGSNAFYKSNLFEKLTFNKKMEYGEDFDLNSRIKKQGLKIKSIKNLIVIHDESPSYGKSLKWLFQSGIGATKLLKKHKKIRLPDLAFFGFLFLIVLSVIEIVFFNIFYLFAILFLYPLLTSFLHTKSKFEFEASKTLGFISAIITNYPLIFSYYAGRLRGLIA